MAELNDFQGFGESAERERSMAERHDGAARDHVQRFAKSLDGTVADGTLALPELPSEDARAHRPAAR